MKTNQLFKYFLFGLLLTQIWACKKDNTTPNLGSPKITFDASEYKMKVGTSMALHATVENVKEPIYSWVLDGKIISTDTTCNFEGKETGEYFITLKVDAENGSTEQQIKVSVLEKLAPKINLQATITAYADVELAIPASTLYTDETSKYTWRLNGSVVSTDSVYIFKSSSLGDNQLTLKVSNSDGEDLKVVALTVLLPPVAELFFDNGRYHITGDATVHKMTVPLGKSIVLAPVVSNIAGPIAFSWTVDGTKQSSVSEYLTFTPTAKGTYKVLVTSGSISAEVSVECVSAEGTFFRPATANSKAVATTAFEYVPAPGQFVNYGANSTASQALMAIQNGLTAESTKDFFAFLGAYGGYYIAGFDHSVNNVAGKADILFNGNAFQGWSEPGIVWVMQDENGNGLPDDMWYELKGSETGKAETISRYAVTYYRPTVASANVLWTDNKGGTGSVDYNGYHTQSYYYPMFIPGTSYTLVGTRLPYSFTTIGGIDYNQDFDWGYVDNFGDGSRLNFWLEDAIKADGTPANLKYIDFIKVQCAALGKGVAVGEVSTEAAAPADLNLNK